MFHTTYDECSFISACSYKIYIVNICILYVWCVVCEMGLSVFECWNFLCVKLVVHGMAIGSILQLVSCSIYQLLTSYFVISCTTSQHFAFITDRIFIVSARLYYSLPFFEFFITFSHYTKVRQNIYSPFGRFMGSNIFFYSVYTDYVCHCL